MFKKKEIKADLRKKCGAEKCRERNRGREICNSSSKWNWCVTRQYLYGSGISQANEISSHDWKTNKYMLLVTFVTDGYKIMKLTYC